MGKNNKTKITKKLNIMKKLIKLTEKDIKRIVERTINEQSFDVDRYQETEDTSYNRLVDYLQPLVDQEIIDSDIRDDILNLAQAYADGPDVEYGDEEDERRYDDRENYGTDDESRYDDRNYQYGNNPDDDGPTTPWEAIKYGLTPKIKINDKKIN